MAEKKGRPTPKRKEAEQSRVVNRLAPAANKEAKKLQKAQARILRAQQSIQDAQLVNSFFRLLF